MDRFLYLSLIALGIITILSLYRAVKGPDVQNRLIAVNIFSTKVIVLISILSILLKEYYFIDVVLVYSLIGFVASVVISGLVGSR